MKKHFCAAFFHYFFVVTFYFLLMDENKFVAIKSIPVVECDGVAFLGKNELFVSSKHYYSRFTVQNWKTGKNNNLGLHIMIWCD